MNSIQVIGMSPAWGLPSPSPFCLKLETWLRIEKIPYVPVALAKPPQSKTGKVPYIVRGGGSLADSSIIIETLAREHGIDLSYGSSLEDQARAHVILRTLEESLYFSAAWERWLHPAYWPITREAYFGQLPSGLRPLIAGFIRRKVRTTLYGQGISRHDPTRIAALGGEDLRSLSTLLGSRPFFLGDRPTVVDASAYGMLANLLAFPERTPLKLAVESHANLIEFCGRIKSAYWNAN